MSAKGLKNMIQKFGETGSVDLKSGRERKSIALTSVDVATKLEDEMSNGVQTRSARGIAWFLDMFVTRYVLNCVRLWNGRVRCMKLYAISCILTKLPIFRNCFLVTCHRVVCSGMEVNNEWSWTFFCQRKPSVCNTQNCSIWSKENQFATQPVPTYLPKVNVWCGLTASYTGLYFFRRWVCESHYLYLEW